MGCREVIKPLPLVLLCVSLMRTHERQHQKGAGRTATGPVGRPSVFRRAPQVCSAVRTVQTDSGLLQSQSRAVRADLCAAVSWPQLSRRKVGEERQGHSCTAPGPTVNGARSAYSSVRPQQFDSDSWAEKSQ
uniref:Uncharacterized protein n=1 Tax=Molossus molossus TaxID=27622 RepID=A0A7J8CS38_MOLMO|nr:hypothetical protein HJG59_009827 [Molossus molossus]